MNGKKIGDVLLDVAHISLRFGGVKALTDISFDVREHEVRAQHAALNERRAGLEALLAMHRPDLRQGEALWPEYDTWDFQPLRHLAYRRVLAAQATVGRRVKTGTKFSRMHRYRCADRLYLVIENDISARAELPEGWGVLIRAGDRLTLMREAPALAPTPSQREALRDVLAGRVPTGCTSPDLPGLFAHA